MKAVFRDPKPDEPLEIDGGNLYRAHKLMVNSGRFWRCRHGTTGMSDGFEWLGCLDCASEDPEAYNAFHNPTRKHS